MMSCRDVLIEECFLRTSDDCIAIYGSRWDNRGDSRNITVRKTSVWADVAHPLMIGTHGDHEKDGDLIENILFEDIYCRSCEGEETAQIAGLSDEYSVRNVIIKNLYRDGRKIKSFEEANIKVGTFAENVRLL